MIDKDQEHEKIVGAFFRRQFARIPESDFVCIEKPIVKDPVIITPNRDREKPSSLYGQFYTYE